MRAKEPINKKTGIVTTVRACDIPAQSALDQRQIDTAYFRDSYCTPLKGLDTGVIEIFVAVFGHHPTWVKMLLIGRNWLARVCGLDAATTDEVAHPRFKSSFRVGEKIGPWPIFALTENELIAGRDNTHLDFRLSILRLNKTPNPTAVVSTICTVHNIFGKIYLFFILPFHMWGIQRLIANAVAAGRL